MSLSIFVPCDKRRPHASAFGEAIVRYLADFSIGAAITVCGSDPDPDPETNDDIDLRRECIDHEALNTNDLRFDAKDAESLLLGKS